VLPATGRIRSTVTTGRPPALINSRGGVSRLSVPDQSLSCKIIRLSTDAANPLSRSLGYANRPRYKGQGPPSASRMASRRRTSARRLSCGRNSPRRISPTRISRARPSPRRTSRGWKRARDVVSRATSSATAAPSQSHNRLDSRILAIFNKTIRLAELPFKTPFGIANEKNLLDPPVADRRCNRWARVWACRNYLLPGTV